MHPGNAFDAMASYSVVFQPRSAPPSCVTLRSYDFTKVRVILMGMLGEHFTRRVFYLSYIFFVPVPEKFHVLQTRFFRLFFNKQVFAVV